MRAAAQLGVRARLGIDRCHVLAGAFSPESFPGVLSGSIALDFRDPEGAAAAIASSGHSIAAIVPTDDLTAEIAARASFLLELRGNSADATYTARNKERMREALHAARVPAPRVRAFSIDESPERILEIANFIPYPCVLKPLLLSTSRGVIRADDPDSFVAAWTRVRTLLSSPKMRAVEDPAGHRILVEEFIDGPEVALEGMLSSGNLRVLALFDKPDPLDGPFFEETIYVTPSRHDAQVQSAIEGVTAAAAQAIGISEGPVHAELRIRDGKPYVIEVAARSIGGLCARTLRFGLGESSLEQIVIESALGRASSDLNRTGASGVMMIPVPGAGVLKAVHGVEDARAVSNIEDLVISVSVGEVLVPFPEGASYPGFIFARANLPEEVESALRQAHSCLRFDLAAQLPRS